MMAGAFLLGFSLATALWWTWTPRRRHVEQSQDVPTRNDLPPGYMRIGDTVAEISTFRLENGKYHTEATFQFPPHEFGPVTLVDYDGVTVSIGTQIMEIGERPRCYYTVQYEQEITHQMLPDGSSVPAK